MKILVVGSGAREHAILHKLRSSSIVSSLLAWPGNAVMEGLTDIVDLPPESSWEALLAKAGDLAVDFIVCGPEQPLAEGLADLAAERGMPLFGPVRRAAQLEASKSFAKDVMRTAGIPTATFVVSDSREACQREASALLTAQGAVVLKASGLAAGKGVFVCKDHAALQDALHHLYETDMRTAAQQVVVEEMLLGREVSFFCFIGQDGVTPLGFAVDFKRLNDNDQGPNTGGMGCYAPVPWLPADAEKIVLQRVVHPLLNELNRRSIPYTGCLYVGIMWSETGPRVIEFNVRLGDPEAQVLAAFDQKDWGIMIARHLGFKKWTVPTPTNASMPHRAAVAVVVASRGYPFATDEDHPELLARSHFQKTTRDITAVYGASIKPSPSADQLLSGKGRILTVTACAETFHKARQLAYRKVDAIVGNSDRLRYRRDIAQQVTQEYEAHL